MNIETVEQPEREKTIASALQSHERLRLKNILVPIDFSQHSVRPVEYAVALAAQLEGILWLLHVVEPPPAYSGFEGIPLAQGESEEVSEAEARMAEFAAKYIPQGIAVTSLVRQGSAVSEISSLAKARNIDLVVISTHGRTGFSRAVYGSMAENIFHRAECPILVVRDEENDFLRPSPAAEGPKRVMLRRILAPLDFSDASKKALRYAQALAWKFGAEIFCVHVVKQEQPLIVVETTAYRRDHEEEAKRKMAEFLHEVDDAIHIETAIEPGVPDRKIVTLAAERQIDLIILGAHCSGVKRFFLGSTTDEVVKHAQCPVLVARENEHDFLE